jgi:Glycosyltransferases involved in cell wall biogenesis
MKLSIIIPVYNEVNNIQEVIKRVESTKFHKEIIVVDDGSTDGSREKLNELRSRNSGLTVIFHNQNQGKGGAIHTALRYVTGELVLIQDADLEYDPSEYGPLLEPFQESTVRVVYGSRNLRKNPRVSLAFFWGGVILSVVANILYGSRLTDITTGYKVFRTDLIKEIDLKGKGFEFCAEVTGRILRRHIPILEVPISYIPRSWDEGKKINSMDGLIALWFLTKIRFGLEKRSQILPEEERA